MPVGFMTLSTSQSSALGAFRDDPEACYEHVNGVITDAKATLTDLFFDVGAELAYALVDNLDDYAAVKAVSRSLGAEGFIKMVRRDRAIEAIEIEADFSS